MDAAGPSTHLTFLFTDIEASTRAWEHQPAGMSLALARHDELLHMAVKSAGGMVFKHTGDGVCAAFPTAPSAVVPALDALEQPILDAIGDDFDATVHALDSWSTAIAASGAFPSGTYVSLSQAAGHS